MIRLTHEGQIYPLACDSKEHGVDPVPATLAVVREAGPVWAACGDHTRRVACDRCFGRKYEGDDVILKQVNPVTMLCHRCLGPWVEERRAKGEAVNPKAFLS